eukprot:TRINITY_DN1962_c0_g1_i8.p1 TRINITY_DN1962_c0_g1~~TRINITY_DN1962_c0_g1_i8.p1  ORF type:complete len:225 (-),score=50.25 TRINITY_DN1962_c0_g1_i8:555-1145(-)
MGILMFLQTMMLISFGHYFLSQEFEDAYYASMDASAAGSEMAQYMESTVFLQISNSSAILILSARTIGFFFTTMPAWQLLLSTAIGQVIINVWVLTAPSGIVSKLALSDVLAIWVYDFAWLLVLDVVKMFANGLWEKYKPAEIDKNPALTAKNRASRRISNNFQAPYAVHNSTELLAKMPEQKKRTSRISKQFAKK